jgi:hypothetical protein
MTVLTAAICLPTDIREFPPRPCAVADGAHSLQTGGWIEMEWFGSANHFRSTAIIANCSHANSTLLLKASFLT